MNFHLLQSRHKEGQEHQDNSINKTKKPGGLQHVFLPAFLLRFVMTFSDLQEHYHNLELLEEAKIALNDICAVKSVKFGVIPVHGSEISRQTEVKALLIDKQQKIIDELQERIDRFNRDQLQPFLDNIDTTKDFKVWNCLYLRFVTGCYWDDIAKMFHENTDAVKARCYRYLKKHL